MSSRAFRDAVEKSLPGARKAIENLLRKELKMFTETPEDMKLLYRTSEILQRLESAGAAIFETDDGPEDYEVIKQLQEIADNVLYRLIQIRSYGVEEFRTNDDVSLNVVGGLTGKWLLLDECSVALKMKNP